MHYVSDLRHTKTDLLILGALLAVATAVRLPYLHLIPIMTDEIYGVLAARSIYDGHFVAFLPFNDTVGPVWAYLLAFIFWLLGPQVLIPRTVVMIIGVLTVGLTYILGRSMGGRWAGVIAGALLAFSPIHTIINSHVAWSNSVTPFFITLAFVVLHAAARRKDGRLLVLGAFLYSLALQTHVSLLVLIPGLTIWFLARRDIMTWLRQPWPYLAVGVAPLGYGNMIIFNVVSGGGSLADVQNRDYAWVSDPTLSIYLTNLKNMIIEAGPTFGGQVPRIVDPIGGLVGGVLLIWLAIALVYAAWRGETMPILTVLSTALIMPYFNKRYAGLLSQRYLSFLMPICFAAMGMLTAQIVDLWRTRKLPLPRAVIASGMVLAILLAVYPMRNTFAHYAVETQAGRDNALSLSLANNLMERLPPDAELYLSSRLRGTRGDGGFRYLRALYYALAVEGEDAFILDYPDIVARLEANQAREVWLVLPSDDYDALSQSFELERIEDSPPVHNEGLLVRYVPDNQEP